jgi:serine/threonine protein kinase
MRSQCSKRSETRTCARMCPSLCRDGRTTSLVFYPFASPSTSDKRHSCPAGSSKGSYGLEYLHSLGIVHRDIRPSNLILDQNDNVIIIDCETSIAFQDAPEVEYLGGFICWPARLLSSDYARYTPQPTDDLFACILVILHMLFIAVCSISC